MSLISLTAIQRKSQSSIDWSAFAQNIAVDTDDISGVIRRDSTNTYSYFDVNPVKSTENVAKNSSRYNLRVNDALSVIASQSTRLVVLPVTSRRGVTVSYDAVFVVNRFTQYLEPVSGGASTRFWYIEDGDTLPVEYVVNETIANIIAQTNSSSALLVRNGITINSGYVEQGGSLIRNTDIDMGQYYSNYLSSFGGYSTYFKRSYDFEQKQIDDGLGNSFSSYVAPSVFADYRQLIIGDPSGNIFHISGKQGGDSFGSNQYYNNTTGEAVLIKYGLNAGPGAGYGVSFQVISPAAVFNMIHGLDEVNGFFIAQNNGFITTYLFKCNELNPNGAGILETPPTYAYTPAEDPADGLVGINSAGELFNTNILPSDAVFESLIVSASDETTALTTGTGKVTFRMPYAMTLSEVRASLTTAQAADGGGGIFTVDINKNGASILSTKITIDNTERTSKTAATPAVVSAASLADDDEISVDIDQIGDGSAKGLKITLIGHRS